MSAFGGKADEIGTKADITARRLPIIGRAVVVSRDTSVGSGDVPRFLKMVLRPATSRGAREAPGTPQVDPQEGPLEINGSAREAGRGRLAPPRRSGQQILRGAQPKRRLRAVYTRLNSNKLTISKSY